MTYFIMIISSVVINYSLTCMYSLFLKSQYRWSEKVNGVIGCAAFAGCFLFMMLAKYHIFWICIMLAYGITVNTLKYKLEKSSDKLAVIYIAVFYFVIYIISYLCVEAFIQSSQPMEIHLNSIFLLSSLVEFLIVSMIEKIHENSIRVKLNKMLVIVSAVLPLLSLYVISMVYDTNISVYRFIAIAIVMIAMNIGIILLLYTFVDNYDREMRNQILEEQNHFYEQQMNLMRESYENVRAVKHDINNSLNTIKNLVEAGEVEDVIEFITETNSKMGDYKALIDTGNTALDGMLNYKVQDALKRNIQCDYKLSIPKGMQINSFDLSAIVGNLMDNSIRETLKTKCPHIWISAQYFKESVLIVVKNTYVQNEHQDEKNENVGESMNISDVHGVGLENVKRIVKKYDGEMIIDRKDHIFAVKVVCFMNMVVNNE